MAVTGVIGVAKAFTTSIAAGPLPSEMEKELGDHLREVGAEYGATTGRPRRMGWFDAVVVRYTVRTNGVSSIALTKIDVLDELATIKICTGYRHRAEL